MLTDSVVRIKQYYWEIVDRLGKINSGFEKKRNKYFWIMAIIYKVILDMYYLLAVSPRYANEGLVSEPSMMNYFLSWLFYIVGYYFVLKVDNYVLAVFFHIQWILTISPVYIVYAMQGDKSIVYIVFIVTVVWIQMMIANKGTVNKPIRLNKGNLKPYVTVVLCIGIATVWIIMLLWNDFVGIKAFNLSYIYAMRSHIVYPPFFGYIVSWTIRAFIPWLLMIGLSEKNIFLCIYSFGFQFLFYMILGQKAPLLLVGVILVVYILSKYNILLLGTYFGMIVATVMGTIGGVLEDIAGAGGVSIIYNALLGERTLFIPAYIKYQFYEFFCEYPKNFFADGMLGKLFSLTSPYKNNLGFTVYAYYNQGSTAVESNTGYLGDSYAQLGIVGMLLIGILVVLVVKFISKYLTHISTPILSCIVVCICVVLNDGAFFTCFFTGGIWIFLILLMIYVRCSDKQGAM